MSDKELLQRALEALNHSVLAFGKICPSSSYAQDVMGECEVAIEELETAIAQPVQPAHDAKDAEINRLTTALKSESDSNEAWQNQHLLDDGVQCRQILALTAELDALRASPAVGDVPVAYLRADLGGYVIVDGARVTIASRLANRIKGRAAMNKEPK